MQWHAYQVAVTGLLPFVAGCKSTIGLMTVGIGLVSGVAKLADHCLISCETDDEVADHLGTCYRNLSALATILGVSLESLTTLPGPDDDGCEDELDPHYVILGLAAQAGSLLEHIAIADRDKAAPNFSVIEARARLVYWHLCALGPIFRLNTSDVLLMSLESIPVRVG